MDLVKARLTYDPVMDRLGSSGCFSGKEIHQELLIFRDERIEIYYAPFRAEYPKALLDPVRILFVGLTPGQRQAADAYQGYFAPEASGADTVSFNGPMRSNLVRIMDSLDLPAALGITTTSDLFTGRYRSMCVSTSLLKYPVFVNGKNYSGNPAPSSHPFLQKMIIEIFLPTILLLNPSALVVPLGVRVDEAIRSVSKQLDPNFEQRCLFGFPHTSGANNGRIAEYMRSNLPNIHKIKIEELFQPR